MTAHIWIYHLLGSICIKIVVAKVWDNNRTGFVGCFVLAIFLFSDPPISATMSTPEPPMVSTWGPMGQGIVSCLALLGIRHRPNFQLCRSDGGSGLCLAFPGHSL